MRKSPLNPIAALLIVPLTLCVSPVRADDLIQIYDLAVTSDPLIREAEQTLFADREAKPQARALLLPNVGIEGTGSYNDVNAWGSTERGSFSRRDSFPEYGASAVVTQSVYNRGNWMTLKQTDDTIAQAEAQYRDAQIELMVRTTEAYFKVLQAADAVTVQEALVRADERQLEQSRQRFDVGLVAITDVNDSQAAYDKSKANLITARTVLDNAWEALRVIVGPIHVPLARLGDKLPLSPPDPNNIDTWADTALRRNFGIIAAVENAAAAKKQIEIEKSGWYPTLELQAGYNMSRSDQDLSTNSDSAFAGLILNVPIYQGGAVASRTRQAGYRFRAAQDQLDQTRRKVDQQVKDAFRGILFEHRGREGASGGYRLRQVFSGVHSGGTGGRYPNPGGCVERSAAVVPGGVRLLKLPVHLYYQWRQAPPGHQHPDPGRAGQGKRLAQPGANRAAACLLIEVASGE